jgi:hypothetical protein
MKAIDLHKHPLKNDDPILKIMVTFNNNRWDVFKAGKTRPEKIPRDSERSALPGIHESDRRQSLGRRILADETWDRKKMSIALATKAMISA